MMLARTLLFMENPGEAMDVVDAAPRRAAAPSRRTCDLALRAIRIVGVFFGVADPANLAELEAWRAGPRGQGPGAKTLTAITSLAVAVPERRRARRPPRWRPSRSTATRCPSSTAAPSRCCRRRCWRWPSPAPPSREWRRIRALAGPARLGAGRDRRRPLGRARERSGRATCVRAIELLERAMEGEALFGSAGNAHMAYSSAFLALRLARARRSRARLGGAARTRRPDRALRRRALLDDQPRRAAAGGRLNTGRSARSRTRWRPRGRRTRTRCGRRGARLQRTRGRGGGRSGDCVAPRGRRAGARSPQRRAVGRGTIAAACWAS